MTDEVLVEVANSVMVVTINRPEARNAINRAVAKEIAAAMDQFASDAAIRVAILTGAGDTFCSGMDLKGFVDGESPVIEGRGFGGIAESPPQKPLIGAVEGYALAGGLELMLVCDLVVAASNAKFGIPEVKRGLVAGAGGLLRLPRQMPTRLAMELALTGDFIDAARACEVGLVNAIVERGTTLDAARELADKIAANGPMAVAASKRIMTGQADWAEEEMFARQNEIAMPVYRSEDAMEGARAFAEKRPPSWKGK